MAIHVSVMAYEALDALDPSPGKIFVDGTLGAGGHTEAIAKAVKPNGCVISFDRDVRAIDAAEARFLKVEPEKKLPIRLAHANYKDFPEALESLGIESIDGILLDLGLSSDQLADRERGFSFDSDGPLDLRFDDSEGEPAWRILEWMSAERIADILFRYGEERYSRRIAQKIVEKRENSEPIRTAAELADLVRKVIPSRKKIRGQVNIDPATRSFQGLRIFVNDELGSLESVLSEIPKYLKPGGRAVIISFHSLEDRIVKTAFREDVRLEPLNKKPLTPSEPELDENPRSRSAKMRVAVKV